MSDDGWFDDEFTEQAQLDEELQLDRESVLRWAQENAAEREAERVAARSAEGVYVPELIDLPGTAVPARMPLIDLSGGTPEETTTRSSSVARDDPPPPPR